LSGVSNGHVSKLIVEVGGTFSNGASAPSGGIEWLLEHREMTSAKIESILVDSVKLIGGNVSILVDSPLSSTPSTAQGSSLRTLAGMPGKTEIAASGWSEDGLGS